MSRDDNDFFDDLRHSWKSHPVPNWEDADDVPSDRVCSRLVPELRLAWQQIPVPHPPVLKAPPAERPWWRPAALAAAAILVLLSVRGFRGGAGNSRIEKNRDRPEEFATIRTRTQPGVDGGLEMIRGRVRLILLTPSAVPTNPDDKE